MTTRAREHVPGATFPPEVRAAAEAIDLAPILAVAEAVAACPLDEKLHPVSDSIRRSTGQLQNALESLRENRPIARKRRRTSATCRPDAPRARDIPPAA